jgi:2-polyprenyl-6-methoxyphenol hydroxylase-like FAD-dependent oxidoreductase
LKDSRIAIVGAGICGLAVGNLLSRAGHDVVLYERVEKPQSLGAGLLRVDC